MWVSQPIYLAWARLHERQAIVPGALFYHIYQTPPIGQDMTQAQFLSGVQKAWIQSFPSPWLVASPRLKNLVCPTIYPLLEGE